MKIYTIVWECDGQFVDSEIIPQTSNGDGVALLGDSRRVLRSRECVRAAYTQLIYSRMLQCPQKIKRRKLRLIWRNPQPHLIKETDQERGSPVSCTPQPSVGKPIACMQTKRNV